MNNSQILLEKYNPSNKDEKVYKIQMLDFLKKEINCFDRSCKSGHFTGSCWLLNQDFSKALLTNHKKLDKWFQLGGHCDSEKNILSVAIKEAKEESGINDIDIITPEIFDIDIHQIPSNSKEESHLHYDVRFLLYSPNTEHFKKNHESKELKWITKDKLTLPNVNASVLRMYKKWISYKFK